MRLKRLKLNENLQTELDKSMLSGSRESIEFLIKLAFRLRSLGMLNFASVFIELKRNCYSQCSVTL